MSRYARALRLSAIYALCALAITILSASTAKAQDTIQQNQPSADDVTPTTTPQDRSHATQSQNTEEAWTILSKTIHDSRHADLRVQALSALGTLGTSDRAEKLISAALQDVDVDIRSAALLAAGQTGNRNFIVPLRSMLDDKEPQIVFLSASALWKLNDHSGENILLAVVDGERSSNPTMRSGALHSVNKKLHDPAALARMGAIQGASIFLGPVGLGISAIDYMRKSGNDDAARLAAIALVAQQQGAEIRRTLIAALGDKDAVVRAAAAKALGEYHDKLVSDALLPLFDDARISVRLFATASYIRITQPSVHRTTKKK